MLDVVIESFARDENDIDIITLQGRTLNILASPILVSLARDPERNLARDLHYRQMERLRHDLRDRLQTVGFKTMMNWIHSSPLTVIH
jgi:hypothetical protein